MSPTATPTAATAREAVEQAYIESWAASAKAATSTPEEARRLLEPYADGEYLEAVLQGIRELQARGQEPWGEPAIHITEVTLLPGRTASLHDCQDVSRAGLADSRTHELIPGTTGSERTHMAADLKRGPNGRWRLTSLVQLEVPCEPSPS